MTKVPVMTRNGLTLTYDTGDVENVNVSTVHHSVESEGPNGTVRRDLTCYSSLDMHIDFKRGACALWVRDEGPAS